jgi:membrane dipeptidase
MRLINLHCNWIWQYAPETTLFDPSLFPEIPQRLPQLDGYLTGTAAAVLACARPGADWERQPDPWPALNDLLVRYEAEFAGRLLMGPADVAHSRAEPVDGLCWGTLAVSGFDWLVRGPADLDRLPALFERGVRVFQPTEGAKSRLAGSGDTIPNSRPDIVQLGVSIASTHRPLTNLGAPYRTPARISSDTALPSHQRINLCRGIEFALNPDNSR